METDDVPSMFWRQVGLLLLIFIFIIGAIFIIKFFSSESSTTEKSDDSSLKARIDFKQTELNLIVASTTEALSRGLARRDGLPGNTGMIFVFDRVDYHGIWMKDMKFAIDILWIDQFGRVVDLKKEISPETYPEIFYPREVSNFVIELMAGFSDNHNIQIGDTIKIPLI